MAEEGTVYRSQLSQLFGGDGFKPGKEYKEDLAERWENKDELEAMLENPEMLGLSQEEIAQKVALAQQQAMAGQQAAVSKLGRDALAGQGFQAGALAEGARALTDQGEGAAAKATVGINTLNQQLIEQRANQVRDQLNQLYQEMIGLRENREDNAKYYTDLAMDAYLGTLEAAVPA